jgi:hypothetical protein
VVGASRPDLGRRRGRQPDQVDGVAALMYRVRAEAAHAARQPVGQQHNTHHPERTRLTPGQHTRHERELAGKDTQISEPETDLGKSSEDCYMLITVIARQYDREAYERYEALARQHARLDAALGAAQSVQAELPGPFSPDHDREVVAYVDGEISAAELYRRTVARY